MVVVEFVDPKVKLAPTKTTVRDLRNNVVHNYVLIMELKLSNYSN